MTRHTIKRPDRIEYAGWLVVDSIGGMRLTRSEPKVGANERKVALTVSVPTSVFKTPELKAELTFDGAPQSVNVSKVEAAVADAVSGFGLTVNIEKVAPK